MFVVGAPWCSGSYLDIGAPCSRVAGEVEEVMDGHAGGRAAGKVEPLGGICALDASNA